MLEKKGTIKFIYCDDSVLINWDDDSESYGHLDDLIKLKRVPKKPKLECYCVYDLESNEFSGAFKTINGANKYLAIVTRNMLKAEHLTIVKMRQVKL